MVISKRARLAVLGLALCAAPVGAQPPQYIARDLSSYPGSPANWLGFTALGIGPGGDAVGFGNDAALRWSLAGSAPLPGQFGVAMAMNAGGAIVGSARGPAGLSQAALWTNGSLAVLGTFGGNLSEARAINNSGLVVGTASTPGGDSHAFSWRNGVMTDLGSLPGLPVSAALAVNQAGRIVGYASDYTRTRAFIYRDGVMTDLGDPPGGPVPYVVPRDINDAGDIVLTAGDHMSSVQSGRAFLHRAGSWIDLGSLYGLRAGVSAINNAGVVVGYTDGPGYAWVYSGGAMHDLNLLIVGGLEARLTTAVDINDEGQILARGLWVGPTHSEVRHYVLTPIPGPPTLVLLIPVLAAARRRR